MQFARKIVLLSAVVMMGAAGGAAAKENDLTNATKPVSVVTVEGMTEYRLPSGLRVVLYPDMSKPTATVNMTYLVGSRHENYGETGMAHLLEHLMFKGSKNYPNPTAEFTKRGFRMNGSTWLDRTNYHVSFTASDDNMKWALGWQADAMGERRLPERYRTDRPDAERLHLPHFPPARARRKDLRFADLRQLRNPLRR